MKICFYALEHHSLGSGGGIASYLDALVPELAKLGHEVHIIVKGKADNVRNLNGKSYLYEFKGGNIHWYVSKIPFIGKHLALPIRELEWSLGFYRTLESIKKKYQIDLIESSETGNLFTAFLERKIPFIIRLHGSTYSFERSTKGKATIGAKFDRILQRYSFKRAKGITSPSKFQKRLFENEHIKTVNVEVIPNPVSTPLESPTIYGEDDIDKKSVPYEKNGIKDPSFLTGQPSTNNPKTIFYAGRIADVKGIWPLLKAFTEVIKQLPDVRLVMAGSSHVSIPTKEIEHFINEHNMADKVELLGYIQKDEIREYYKACSVYVVPSYYETFCISAIEAMMYEKPVIASSGTALEEIVEDEVTGILIPPGDDRALADALLKLLKDVELARHMGEVGRQKALSKYQAKFIAQKTLEFYKDMINVKEKNNS